MKTRIAIAKQQFPLILKAVNENIYIFVNEDRSAVQYEASSNKWSDYGKCDYNNKDFAHLYEPIPTGSQIVFEQSAHIDGYQEIHNGHRGQ